MLTYASWAMHILKLKNNYNSKANTKVLSTNFSVTLSKVLKLIASEQQHLWSMNYILKHIHHNTDITVNLTNYQACCALLFSFIIEKTKTSLLILLIILSYLIAPSNQ